MMSMKRLVSLTPGSKSLGYYLHQIQPISRGCSPFLFVSSVIAISRFEMTPEARANESAIRNANTEATLFFIGSLLITFILVALARSPFTVLHYTTGRFKQGWRLKRSQENSGLTSFRDWRFRGRQFTHTEIHIPRAERLLVQYLYWYNSLTLKSIPGFQSLTLARLLVTIFYTAAVLFAFFWKHWHSPEFLIHFRRPAIISIAQLPVVFLLSMKNNICGVFGIGYERINFLHRLVGRIIILCSIIHTILILKAQVSPIRDLIMQSTIMSGSIAMIILLFMALLSLGSIRRKFYQIFLAGHVLGYILLLFALWKHAEATHLPIIACCACKVFDEVLQAINTTWRTAQFTSLPSSVTVIEIPNLGTGWRAGQHVLLRVYSPRYFLEKHPFTIANAPATESPHGSKNKVVIVVRARGDYTRRIHEIGLTKAAMQEKPRTTNIFDVLKNLQNNRLDSKHDSQLLVSIEGPYGHIYEDMRCHETAVLIGTGVAFTFVASIFEELIGSSIKGLGATRNIVIIWTLREIDMVEFFLEPIQENVVISRRLGITVEIRLHVTSSMATLLPCPLPELQVIPGRVDLRKAILESVDKTVAEINALGRCDRPRGIGIASASASTTFSNAVKDACLCIDQRTFLGIGGVRVYTESFGSQ